MFGTKGDESIPVTQTLTVATDDALSETGIDVTFWQAGFMLGGEGEEIVENVLFDGGEVLVDAQSTFIADAGERELLYVEEEESFVNSLAIEQSAKNDYFDMDAFGSSPDANLLSQDVAELELLMKSFAEKQVDLDTIFDEMGLSGNRVTDENLFFEGSSISMSDAQEINNPLGDEIVVGPELSLADLDFGKIIDQIADQMFISDES
ncbi:hypothetical protein NBZ79_09135 [Sneathiella marina]|uniref:Haemolysin-type calcium binding-related domain-containing protein n=1 Tax=Sneathiella marina TaxID=2950108 RepID=A0ABY4W7V7_9PROT|nr:hypothetical protein [Sneathiella marina]USG63138.1 hypothetical protein NBZ79_09135 [Sneathiella marina]